MNDFLLISSKTIETLIMNKEYKMPHYSLEKEFLDFGIDKVIKTIYLKLTISLMQYLTIILNFRPKQKFIKGATYK